MFMNEFQDEEMWNREDVSTFPRGQRCLDVLIWAGSHHITRNIWQISEYRLRHFQARLVIIIYVPNNNLLDQRSTELLHLLGRRSSFTSLFPQIPRNFKNKNIMLPILYLGVYLIIIQFVIPKLIYSPLQTCIEKCL